MADGDPPTLPEWAPDASRVAALLWEHTRDSQDTAGEGGVLVDEPRLGEFTTTTTPPLALVMVLIAQACDTTTGLLDGHEPCTVGLTVGITSATAYLAAALVEQAREPQAAGSETSAYKTLLGLWTTSGPVVAARVQAACPLTVNPDDPDAGGRLGPVAVLPVDPGRIGWEANIW